MNKRFLLSILAILLTSTYAGPDFTFYHTTDQVHQELFDLQNNCNGNLEIETLLEDPKMVLVHINKKDSKTPESEKQKIFVVFGEHAREMISVETGLHTVKALCGQKKLNENFDIEDLLEKNHFAFVANANPTGRILVENGQYCQRVNKNGVDLNRNWDSHWILARGGDTDSGPQPFSEIETQTIRDRVTAFNPKVFLIVHSGTFGLYTPYAFTEKLGPVNEDGMLKVLNVVDKKYCNCHPGGAATEVGYLSSGTSVDYVYDHGAPYSFAWEIYTPQYVPQEAFIAARITKSKNLRGYNSNPLYKHTTKAQSYLDIINMRGENLNDEKCFYAFNPITQEDYNHSVDTWASAILTTTQQVNEIELSKAAESAVPPAQ